MYYGIRPCRTQCGTTPSAAADSFPRQQGWFTEMEQQQADLMQALKEQILDLVEEYYRIAHPRPAFQPGRTRIPYSGRVYDEREMTLLADSALDFWLTAGPYAD